jgi:hypothetical protein
VARNDMAYKPPVTAVVFTNYDNCLPHIRVLFERRFYFG